MSIISADWLGIFKINGWKTGATCIGFAVFLFLARDGIVPPLEPWVVECSILAMILAGVLCVAAVFESIVKSELLRAAIVHFLDHRIEAREVRVGIAFMSAQEREIIAFLLEKKQKMFTGDGGHAATLISKGIVRRALRPGQSCQPEEVPFFVPNHLWKVLEDRKKDFPYLPKIERGVEVNPWRVHWMAR